MSVKPIIEMFPVGMLETNCVLAVCPDTREAIVVDPGDDAPRIMKVVEKLGATVKYIVDTHGHPDHVLANAEVKAMTGAKLGIHPLDAKMLESAPPELTFWLTKPYQPATPDFYLNEGDKITIGNVTFDVLHTPGHTRGHISLVTDEVAIVGDVLFFQSIGRTDFPGGSFEQLAESIRAKLFTLSDATRVYPGHGPSTTIGDEKKFNPFVGENAMF
ncbi:MAG: MBL fold metallo-hydrolase [Chloroflexi bacterium]|nr:MBL fold metallo-hydrolase [Chloroflexota bacterium]